MYKAKRCILSAPQFRLNCRQGPSEVPVIQVASSVLQGLRLMAQPFSWELNGAVGLQHPFSPQVLRGVVHISPPPPEVYFPGACLQYSMHCDGGCLTVSNMGAPTQEESLLSLYISFIGTGEVKRT